MVARVGCLLRYGCAALAAVALLPGPAFAQTPDKEALLNALGNTNPDPLPPGGPAPQMIDGHPDLSGIWYRGLIGRPSAWSRTPRQDLDEEPVPFRPEVKARIDSMTPAERQLTSPEVLCLPRGVPAMVIQNPQPFQLITVPDMFVQLREGDRDWRVVHTDRRPHPEYPDPLYNGNSSAWWEGDTLIIDSIGFNEKTLVRNGWPHSDQMRVVERFRRPSLNYMEYQVTVEDPQMLTAPWTSDWRQFTLSQIEDELLENYCVNNQTVDHLERLLATEAN